MNHLINANSRIVLNSYIFHKIVFIFYKLQKFGIGKSFYMFLKKCLMLTKAAFI